MVVLVVLLAIALAVSLGFHMFRPGTGPSLDALHKRLGDAEKARNTAEADAERRRRELDELKAQVGEVKDQLKQAKKKVYDLEQGQKDDRDLVKARAEVERQASVQLENVRAELAHALSELAKLREGAEKGRRRPEAQERDAAAPPAEAPKKIIRELSEAEKERLDRAEHQARRAQGRAAELEKEIKRLKGRSDTQQRVYMVTKGELDLLKDKFKALEKRLNRTLLENDLLRRAITALEKQTGVPAERTELSREEIAASDRKVDERMAEEAKRDAERMAQSQAQAETEQSRPAGAEATQPTPPQDDASTSPTAPPSVVS